MIPTGWPGPPDSPLARTGAHSRGLRREGSESFKENGIVVTAVSRATRASVKVFLSERVLIRLSSRRRAPDEGSGAGR